MALVSGMIVSYPMLENANIWLAAAIMGSPTTSSLARRAPSDYQEVFPGIGPDDPSSRDASIEGPAYLTFKVVNNATYNVAECVDFCSGIPKCGTFFCR